MLLQLNYTEHISAACNEERCFTCQRVTSQPTSSSPTPSLAPSPPTQVLTVSGELQQWHKVTVDLLGPITSEGATPNPFSDYRFVAVFSHIGTPEATFRVPGYYAADGNAGETSAVAGRVFRAHLSPPHTGGWTVTVEFTEGVDVAVAGGGTPVSGLHGASASFDVLASDKSNATRDFRAKGMLLPVAGER
jgi:hypothetical protein